MRAVQNLLDATKLFEKSQEKFRAIASSPVPPCRCRRKPDPTWNADLMQHWQAMHTFTCDGCRRQMTNCYGLNDELPNGQSLLRYCDDCAAVLGQARDSDRYAKLYASWDAEFNQS